MLLVQRVCEVLVVFGQREKSAAYSGCAFRTCQIAKLVSYPLIVFGALACRPSKLHLSEAIVTVQGKVLLCEE